MWSSSTLISGQNTQNSVYAPWKYVFIIVTDFKIPGIVRNLVAENVKSYSEHQLVRAFPLNEGQQKVINQWKATNKCQILKKFKILGQPTGKGSFINYVTLIRSPSFWVTPKVTFYLSLPCSPFYRVIEADWTSIWSLIQPEDHIHDNPLFYVIYNFFLNIHLGYSLYE